MKVMHSAVATVVGEADGVRLGADAGDDGKESGEGDNAGEHCF